MASATCDDPKVESDQQFMSCKSLLKASQMLFVACLDRFSDLKGGGEEADALAALSRGPPQFQNHLDSPVPLSNRATGKRGRTDS